MGRAAWWCRRSGSAQHGRAPAAAAHSRLTSSQPPRAHPHPQAHVEPAQGAHRAAGVTGHVGGVVASRQRAIDEEVAYMGLYDEDAGQDSDG